MGGTGLEQGKDSTGNSHIEAHSGAESGALDAQNAPNDHRLAAIIDAWPSLPEPIKAGILAMIRAAGGAG